MESLNALVLTLAFVFPPAPSAPQMRSVVTFTTGSGSATEPDRSYAMDEATQQAQNWANSACIGSVTNTSTTSAACFVTGNDDENNVNYTCLVTVKAACEIDYRGR